MKVPGFMIVLLSLIAGAAFAAWPTYHGDASLTGYVDESFDAPLSLAWRYNSGGSVYSTPVSDGEHIFFAAGKGRILSIDLKGQLVWEKVLTRVNDAGASMPVRVEAPLLVADDVVLVGSTRGVLYALDVESGAERWRYETGGTIMNSPNRIGPEAVVVLDQRSGSLHGIDLKCGDALWVTDGVERCDGAPGVGNGTIAFGSCLAALHVYDFEGTHLGDIPVEGDGQIAGGVAVDRRFAYAGVRDGGLICFDLESMSVKWSSDESDEQTFATPALTDTQVVYTSDDGLVYVVKKENAELLWKYDTAGLPFSPVIAGDKVVVAADGVLRMLDLKSGADVWNKEVSDEITSPALVADLILVGADDGTVSAFKSGKNL